MTRKKRAASKDFYGGGFLMLLGVLMFSTQALFGDDQMYVGVVGMGSMLIGVVLFMRSQRSTTTH
jgi:hypothetical protein